MGLTSFTWPHLPVQSSPDLSPYMSPYIYYPMLPSLPASSYSLDGIHVYADPIWDYGSFMSSMWSCWHCHRASQLYVESEIVLKWECIWGGSEIVFGEVKLLLRWKWECVWNRSEIAFGAEGKLCVGQGWDCIWAEVSLRLGGSETVFGA